MGVILSKGMSLLKLGKGVGEELKVTVVHMCSFHCSE
jgi:hypothetical protein